MQSLERCVLIAGSKYADRTQIMKSLISSNSSTYKFTDIYFNEKQELVNVIERFKSLLKLYSFETRPEIFDEGIKWIILETGYQEIQEQGICMNKCSKRRYIYEQKKLREIASYYGIPIVDIRDKTNGQVCQDILQMVSQENYSFVRDFELKSLTYDKLFSMNVEKFIADDLLTRQQVKIPKTLIQELTKDGVFGQQIIDFAQNKPSFKMKLIAKWLVSGNIKVENDNITVSRQNIQVKVNQKYVLHLSVQGQSKMLYRVISTNHYFDKFVFIVLKSTIYSHKKQSTGEIQNLGKVRAYGSKIFLQFLNRNDLNHAYWCVNQEGIIFSEFQQITPIQIVFKKYFVGTDKHSYYGMQKQQSLVQPTTDLYKSGIYIRFDWRNPNHISTKTRTDLIQNPYYYLIESQLTKNIFFDTYLHNPEKAIPYGDKCVYPQLLNGMIDVDKARYNLIKLYCCFQYYMRQVGLQILDGCFMLDNEAETFWSQINPDCMRIKSNNLKEQYDKDIWRTGGSSSKEQILKKWNLLNSILTKYLLEHRQFLSKDYPYREIASQILASPNLIQSYKHIYRQLSKPKNNRKQVIMTIDISKQMPSLVVSSNVSQIHSSGDVYEALQKIQYFDDILVVNLDGAFADLQNSQKNISLIKQVAKKHQIMSGGGIHNIKIVQDLLNNGINKIVVATNTSHEFLQQIPSNRLIVQLSINQHNEVLIDGRKTNTKVNVITKINQLIDIGVKTFSITFVKKQGHLKGLPYEQIEQLIFNLPSKVQKLIIAGGITTINDLRFLWRFQKVVPQLGSAIWKDRIKVGEIFKQIANFDQHGLIPAVIRSNTNILKGQVFMNEQALAKTVQTGYLHRYSRQHKRVMKKGDISGDVQKVSRVSFDCDADSVLVTVSSQKPFCHLGVKSCYHCQNLSLSTINEINEHIKSKTKQKSYSGLMQSNPGLALSKLFQQTWELAYADRQHQLSQCADLMAHFLMYVNGMGIQFEDIVKQLSSRSMIIKKVIKSKSTINIGKIVIGLGMYSNNVNYQQLLNILGIKITSSSEQIVFEIVDEQKYSQYFGQKSVELIAVDPIDIPWLLTVGLIDMAICLNITIYNNPEVSQPTIQLPVPFYKLCLLQRKNQQIKLLDYKSCSKLQVASQFVKQTHNYLTKKLNVIQQVLGIYRIHGRNESYLLNESHCNISLCDALVYKSKINENLEVFETITPQNGIKIGLYKTIRM